MRDNERALPLALVMGGAGGLGLAAVRRMGIAHRVLLADVNLEQARRLAEQLEVEGCVVEAIGCDVTRDDSVAALFARVREIGPLRTLVNVVGLSPASGDWRAIINVNLAGARRVADAALPTFEHGGAAVYISSIAAHRVHPEAEILAVLDDPLSPTFADDLEAAVRTCGREMNPRDAYGYSKHGLNRMCRTLAAAWGAGGARIASVSPGLIRTPMGAREFVHTPVKFDILALSPIQRQCSVMEVMDAVEFLASEKASFVTGTDLLVDGGVIGSDVYGRIARGKANTA